MESERSSAGGTQASAGRIISMRTPCVNAVCESERRIRPVAPSCSRSFRHKHRSPRPSF